MRYLRYLAIALFTFGLGVGISPIRFYSEAAACGRMTDGDGGFSVSLYRSNYFVKVIFAHEGYGSAEQANDAFNRHLNDAVKIIEVTPKTSKQGVTIGRRAVAVFFEPAINQYYATVFWTEARLLHSVTSSSFIHVIEFEKREI